MERLVSTINYWATHKLTTRTRTVPTRRRTGPRVGFRSRFGRSLRAPMAAVVTITFDHAARYGEARIRWKTIRARTRVGPSGDPATLPSPASHRSLFGSAATRPRVRSALINNPRQPDRAHGGRRRHGSTRGETSVPTRLRLRSVPRGGRCFATGYLSRYTPWPLAGRTTETRPREYGKNRSLDPGVCTGDGKLTRDPSVSGAKTSGRSTNGPPVP